MTELPKLLKPKEVCVILRLNRVQTVYEYIEEGKLEAYKIGRWYRIDEQSVITFLESRKTPP